LGTDRNCPEIAVQGTMATSPITNRLMTPKKQLQSKLEGRHVALDQGIGQNG